MAMSTVSNAFAALRAASRVPRRVPSHKPRAKAPAPAMSYSNTATYNMRASDVLAGPIMTVRGNALRKLLDAGTVTLLHESVRATVELLCARDETLSIFGFVAADCTIMITRVLRGRFRWTCDTRDTDVAPWLWQSRRTVWAGHPDINVRAGMVAHAIANMSNSVRRGGSGVGGVGGGGSGSNDSNDSNDIRARCVFVLTTDAYAKRLYEARLRELDLPVYAAAIKPRTSTSRRFITCEHCDSMPYRRRSMSPVHVVVRSLEYEMWMPSAMRVEPSKHRAVVFDNILMGTCPDGMMPTATVFANAAASAGVLHRALKHANTDTLLQSSRVAKHVVSTPRQTRTLHACADVRMLVASQSAHSIGDVTKRGIRRECFDYDYIERRNIVESVRTLHSLYLHAGEVLRGVRRAITATYASDTELDSSVFGPLAEPGHPPGDGQPPISAADVTALPGMLVRVRSRADMYRRLCESPPSVVCVRCWRNPSAMIIDDTHGRGLCAVCATCFTSAPASASGTVLPVIIRASDVPGTAFADAVRRSLRNVTSGPAALVICGSVLMHDMCVQDLEGSETEYVTFPFSAQTDRPYVVLQRAADAHLIAPHRVKHVILLSCTPEVLQQVMAMPYVRSVHVHSPRTHREIGHLSKRLSRLTG